MDNLQKVSHAKKFSSYSQYLNYIKPIMKSITIYFKENSFLPKKRYEEYDLDKFQCFFLQDSLIFQNKSEAQVYPISEITYIETILK